MRNDFDPLVCLRDVCEDTLISPREALRYKAIQTEPFGETQKTQMPTSEKFTLVGDRQERRGQDLNLRKGLTPSPV